MSQANIDFVLGRIQPQPDVDFVPLFRDDEVWAALVEASDPFFHPDFKIVVRDLPDGDRTAVGLDGLRALWLDWLSPWATYRAEVVKAVDLGEGSTVEVQDELASVWTVRDGKIPYVEFYASTHAEALEAVGLAG